MYFEMLEVISEVIFSLRVQLHKKDDFVTIGLRVTAYKNIIVR